MPLRVLPLGFLWLLVVFVDVVSCPAILAVWHKNSRPSVAVCLLVMRVNVSNISRIRVKNSCLFVLPQVTIDYRSHQTFSQSCDA